MRCSTSGRSRRLSGLDVWFAQLGEPFALVRMLLMGVGLGLAAGALAAHLGAQR